MKLDTCKINELRITRVEIAFNTINAEVGFLIDSKPFGVVTLSGLDNDEKVAEAARSLVEAIEMAAAARVGEPVEGRMPANLQGLLNPRI